MKVVVDGRLFSDPLTLTRGMGRYSLNQRESLRRFRPDLELVALVRPDGRESCRRAAPCLAIEEIPPELCGSLDGHASSAARLGREAEYAEWIRGLRPDVLFSLTPFLLSLEPFPPVPGPCPTVTNVYDLIPLVYRKQYLVPGTGTERDYMFVLSRLACADALVAISEFTRAEAVSYLGIPAAKFRVGYPIPAPVFRPSPRERRAATLGRFGLREGRDDGYVLTVPHTHHTKNLRTLLRAWAGLPEDFRRRRSLVLTCDLGSAEMAVLRSWMAEDGLGEGVVPTGYVSDEELVDLYSAAWLYVHPSRYEGFGLPVVEAQACGAGVVAAAAASLPEAVGDGGILVDPEDPAAFRDALVDLDVHAERLAVLRERAPTSAGRFTSEALADAVSGALRHAIEARRPHASAPRRARVALVSPVPPQASGIADYAAELAAALERRAEIELFVDRGVAPAPSLARWPAHDSRRLAERHGARRFDAVLHQLGASTFHVFVEEALRIAPGIVTLHDLVWGRVPHHLARTPAERRTFRLDLERIEGSAALDEFERIEASGLGRDGDALDSFFSRHPMVGDVVRASRGVVVHFPRAAEFVSGRHPGIPVRYFPMGVADPLRPGIPGRLATRARYGLPVEGFVVGAFGIADPVKRLGAAVRAIARLSREGGGPLLAVVGPFPSEAYREELRVLAASLGGADRVRFLGAPPLRDFEALLGACDAVLNLRYPSRMQMSAVLVRALATGAPVAITDLPEWGFLPDEACERVPAGVGEVDALAEFLGRLRSNPEERARRGDAARKWYVGNATLDVMASNYLAFADELAEGPREE